VSRLSRRYGSLDVSQSYGPLLTVRGIALPSFLRANLTAQRSFRNFARVKKKKENLHLQEITKQKSKLRHLNNDNNNNNSIKTKSNLSLRNEKSKTLYIGTFTVIQLVFLLL
jgi:hypothetical protein